MNEPHPPKLTPEQLEGLKMILGRTVELLAASQGWGRTCLACQHFDERAETCTFYSPAMRPPARVIVTGCPNWAGQNPF